MILAICGHIGSGKSATSEYIQSKYGFKTASFADSLKQSISIIFGWDFELLQGKTKASRAWREMPDEWWSNRLNIPNLTPRYVLQNIGTEAMRFHFHPDIWLASLEKKISNTNENLIIDDCRFANEMASVRKMGGTIIRINGPFKPSWYNTAIEELQYIKEYGIESGWLSSMAENYPDIHISEWGWLLEPYDFEINNDSTIENLHSKIDSLFINLRNSQV
jgi:hypothetical protein